MNPDWSEQDCRRNGNQGLFTRVQDPGERRAFSEAQEGPVIEAVYTQEEICDQEWCGRIMENTELAICDSKESPELEAVRIKEEAPELECVHITEEVSKENTLEENIVKLESSHCEDCPPELVCVKPSQRVSEDTCSSVGEEDTGLGSSQGTPCWGAAPSTSSTASDPGRRNSAPAPQSKISTDGGLQRKQKRRETTPQEEYVKKLRTRSVLSAQDSRPLALGYTASPHPSNSATQGSFSSLQTPQQIPSEQVLYHCTECGSSFTDLGSLQTHQRAHAREKPYECPDCGKRFNQKFNLQTHQRIHTGEKPYHCADCGKSFTRKSRLRLHQRIQTGEKPYACPECGRRFNRKDNLRSHHVTHTGEKPFECSVCGKRFAVSNKLKKHSLVHRDPVSRATEK
ncbi:zinc finger and SCAN domain-containing protein 2-like [Polyodon spathula]|uniref:zinc finger and SCAN domain-containing protein 2-like n=1 Tax=Polyodon spathula TaxID=7913 RepID=UPI001B7EBCFE|nr:zinc finger and SCAN domain-containing protein 2-like [Polyodon spathula]